MKNVGQNKCDILRQIRRKVCALNGIENTERDCMYTGDDCKGTCPFCDMQLERINAQLAVIRNRGKTVSFEGLKELYIDLIQSEQE